MIYDRLSRPSSAVAERPHDISEADLARLWQGQQLPPEVLTTTAGLRLRVVHPGLPGRGPGPDFRNATIASADDDRLWQGDVELHVLASDYWRHGHHRDAAYNMVVLHLVFRDDAAQVPASRDRPLFVVALEPWVHERARTIEAWLRQLPDRRQPYQDAITRLGVAEVTARLAAMGWRRFRQKVEALENLIAAVGPDEALYQCLLEALGYSANRIPFLNLARGLPWQQVRDYLLAEPPASRDTLAEALMLGCGGLLPDCTEQQPAHPHIAQMNSMWQRCGPLQVVASSAWRTTGQRPENHPARRAVGGARLLSRYVEQGLVEGLLSLVATGSARGLLEALTIGVAPDSYWASDGNLASTARVRTPVLIGRGRAVEIAANVVLPFAVAWGEARGSADLLRTAQAMYAALPRATDYGITDHINRALQQPSSGRRLPLRMIHQQGMLYLYHSFCRQNGCSRCPLI